MTDEEFDAICAYELDSEALNPLKMMSWSTFYDMISVNLHEDFAYLSFFEILSMDTDQLRDMILNCVVMNPDESVPIYKVKAYRWILEANMDYKAIHRPDRNYDAVSDPVDEDDVLLIPENIHIPDSLAFQINPLPLKVPLEECDPPKKLIPLLNAKDSMYARDKYTFTGINHDLLMRNTPTEIHHLLMKHTPTEITAEDDSEE